MCCPRAFDTISVNYNRTARQTGILDINGAPMARSTIIGAQFEGSRNSNNVKSVPTPLFHYCSIRVFHSIILNRCLWLSSAFGTRDYHEIYYGFSIFEDLAPSLVQDNVYKTVRQHLEEITAYYEIFIASLSSNGDMAVQWNQYADQGRGVAIGFESASFNARPGGRVFDIMPSRSVSIDKVSYDPEAQRARIKDRIEWLNRFAQIGPDPPAYAIYMDSAFFKQPQYIAEDEWRIVYIATKARPAHIDLETERDRSLANVKFRTTISSIVPYVDFPLFPNSIPPIREVILGPNCEAEPRHVTQLLEAHGFEDVQVGKSGTKQRAPI